VAKSIVAAELLLLLFYPLLRCGHCGVFVDRCCSCCEFSRAPDSNCCMSIKRMEWVSFCGLLLFISLPLNYHFPPFHRWLWPLLLFIPTMSLLCSSNATEKVLGGTPARRGWPFVNFGRTEQFAQQCPLQAFCFNRISGLLRLTSPTRLARVCPIVSNSPSKHFVSVRYFVGRRKRIQKTTYTIPMLNLLPFHLEIFTSSAR